MANKATKVDFDRGATDAVWAELEALRARNAELVAVIKAALPEDVHRHGGFFINWNGDRVHRIEMSPAAYRGLVAAVNKEPTNA